MNVNKALKFKDGLEEANKQGEAKIEEQSEQPEQSKKKKILAVDDVSFFLKNLETQLKDTEYELVCISSGKFALTYLQKNKPDIILLDIEMPGMNGYELSEKIRELGHTAPIIFLTGTTSKDNILKAAQKGAAEYIVKPFNKEKLLEKIEKQLLLSSTP